MPRRPKNLQQSAWNAVDTKYADISSPEWVTTTLLPQKFWTDPHNHRRYIEWLSRELGIKQLDDWYKILASDFLTRRGGGFLEYYANSHIKAITSLYPKHNWEIWRFRQVPSGFWDDSRNIIAYAKWFEKQFGVAQKEDWYKVQQDDLYDLCGAGLMDRFNCSVSQLVSFLYPEYNWLPWRFPQTEKHFWREKQNCLTYLRWLELKLKLKSPEGWYRVKREDLARHHGGSLYVISGFTRLELLRELHPDIEWYEWKFMQVSPGFWKSKSNRRRYLKWLEKELGYSKLSDWYQVKSQDFYRLHGATLVDFVFNRDIVAILKELYPKSKWLEWKFNKVPVGFWDNPENCRRYLRWFAKRVGIKRRSDWYRILSEDFQANFGGGFIKRFRMTYGGLIFAYPNHKWLPWLFDRIPKGFWDDKKNRERFLRWVGKQMRFKTADDWQSLTAEMLRQIKGGNGIIQFLSVPQIRKEGASTLRS